MTTVSSFDRAATVTASTKRVGAVVDRLTPDPTTYITSLSCLPLMPVDANLAQEYEFRFREVLQTFVKGILDIVEKDILVVDSVDYNIRAVEDWPWKDEVVQRLFLDEVK